MKTIGIIGSRRRNTPLDYMAVKSKFLELYKSGDYIVSGGCPKGADNFAEDLAKSMGIPIIIFHPNWEQKGRAAGIIRNTEIAKRVKVLIACVAKDRTGGTEDTIKKFLHQTSEDKLYIV